MTASDNFQIDVSANDQASPAFRQLAVVMAGVTATTGGLRGQFASVAAAAANVGASIRNVTGQVLGALGPVAGLAAGFGTWGLVSITRETAAAGAAVKGLQDSLGATTAGQQDGVQSFVARLQAAKVPIAEAQTAFAELGRNLFSASHGGNASLADLMRRLGINIRGANGQVRTAADMLPQLSRAFEVNTDALTRQAMAQAMFGQSGGAMIGVLAQMNAAAAGGSQAGVYSYAPTQTEIENLNRAHGEFTNLGDAFQGLKDKIGAELAPVLAPVLRDLADFILVNRQDWAAGITASVKGLGTWFKENRETIRGWITSIGNGARAVGAFMDRWGALRVITVAVAAIMAGPLLGAIAGVGTALAALGVALWANPMVLAIGIIVLAMAGLAVLIYNNLDEIKAFFGRAFTDIKASCTALGKFLVDKGVEGLTAAADIVKTAWDGVATFFEGLWDRIKPFFTFIGEAIEPLMNDLRALNRWLTPPGRTGRNGGTSIGPEGYGGYFIPGAYAPPGAAPRGTVQQPQQAFGRGLGEVVVRFENAPAEMRIASSRSEPGLPAPVVEVGYAFGRRWAT